MGKFVTQGAVLQCSMGMTPSSPALLDNCKCICNWGGSISVNFPGNGSTATGK